MKYLNFILFFCATSALFSAPLSDYTEPTNDSSGSSVLMPVHRTISGINLGTRAFIGSLSDEQNSSEFADLDEIDQDRLEPFRRGHFKSNMREEATTLHVKASDDIDR